MAEKAQRLSFDFYVTASSSQSLVKEPECSFHLRFVSCLSRSLANWGVN